MQTAPLLGPLTQPPAQPKAGPGAQIFDPTKPQVQSPIPPSIDPMRQRLAQAIMTATGKGVPQGPAGTSPLPGPGPIIAPRGGPNYGQGKPPMLRPPGQQQRPRMMRPQPQNPQRRFPGP